MSVEGANSGAGRERRFEKPRLNSGGGRGSDGNPIARLFGVHIIRVRGTVRAEMFPAFAFIATLHVVSQPQPTLLPCSGEPACQEGK
jgi:hypothetical protein